MKQRIKRFGFYISIFILACSTVMVSSCDSSSTEDPVVAPGTPTALTASDGIAESLVALEWTPPEEGTVSFYRLYRAPVTEGTTGTYVLRKDFLYPTLNTDGTLASFDDNQLSKGKIYSYRVSAVNDGGESELSDPATGYADALAPDLPLPPSSGLKATNNQVNKVYLDWDAVPGVTSYHVYRSSSPMGEYTEIGEVTDLDAVELVISTEPALSEFYAFCDEQTVEGQAFYYRVSSENSEGEGPMSDIVNGWFPYPVITVAPGGLTATEGIYANKIALTWEPVPTATSYVIYYYDNGDGSTACSAPSAGGAYNQLAASSGNTYDHTAADPDDPAVQETRYCYSVKARNEAGESNEYATAVTGYSSSSGAQSPGNPLGFTTTTDGVNIITLSWTRNDIYATHFLIYRSTESLTGYTLHATVDDPADGASNDITWNDGDGSIGSVGTDADYYYKVKAVVYAGGDPANEIETESSLTTAERGFAYPTIPGSTSVTATDDAYWNRINISWDALDRADTYTIYRKIGLGGTWERQQKEMTATTYIDDSDDVVALWDTDVYYRVYGVNSNDDSTPDPEDGSETANYGEDIGTVELQQPSLDASHTGYREITISWGAISGDDLAGSVSYKLYRNSSLLAIITHDFVSGGSYTYEDTDVSAAQTTYSYYVIPVMGGHEGPTSNTDSAGSLW